jgi:hypothetical protein
MDEPDYEALSKGLSRDMSPQAIARRLDIASELYDLARVLAKARPLGKVEGQSRGPEANAPRTPGHR